MLRSRTISQEHEVGEAKRRAQHGLQRAAALRQRIDAGAFGPAAARRCVLVIDKAAPQAREALDALRAAADALGLAAALEGEAFRVWEASALFRYVVLVGGGAAPAAEVLLAADLRRLVGSALPQAAARFAAGTPRPGLSVEVDAAGRDELDAALRRLRLAD